MFYFNVRHIQEQLFSCSSSRLLMFFKIGVLKIFLIFTGKKACNSIKKRLQHGYFPVNMAKFLKTTSLIEHLRWLLLQVLFKKFVPKDFANFARTYRFRSPFLSSSFPINLQLYENSGSGRRVRQRCFAVNFAKFLKAILCRATQNDYSWTLRGAAEKKYLDIKNSSKKLQ